VREGGITAFVPLGVRRALRVRGTPGSFLDLLAEPSVTEMS
jgi:hypothetical protein